MKIRLLLSAALFVAAPAFAQDATSVSGSGAQANSGSISGSSADGNQQGQGQTQTANNNGIGTSASRSDSNSDANSASISHSGAYSDQGQSQVQGQSATNQQGVSVANTFNSYPLKRTYVGTNTAVPLAASSSFSSDYCGGTTSGGASIAPIGLSIGGGSPTFDSSCRYARLAEKAGMLAANAYNMGFKDMVAKAWALEAWATCNMGPQQDRHKGDGRNYTMEACNALGLLSGEGSPASPPVAEIPPPVSEAVTPMEAAKPNTTQYEEYKYKTPRN